MTAARWILRGLLLVMFWVCFVLALSQGCAGAPRSASCHPGQHVCQTDAECEDEEAYLLDMDEGAQR